MGWIGRHRDARRAGLYLFEPAAQFNAVRVGRPVIE
jgi:hypothetical protein